MEKSSYGPVAADRVSPLWQLSEHGHLYSKNDNLHTSADLGSPRRLRTEVVDPHTFYALRTFDEGGTKHNEGKDLTKPPLFLERSIIQQALVRDPKGYYHIHVQYKLPRAEKKDTYLPSVEKNDIFLPFRAFRAFCRDSAVHGSIQEYKKDIEGRYCEVYLIDLGVPCIR